MNASEAIEAILENQGRTKRSLAQEIGISPQALSKRLSGDMKAATLVEMANLLGYKIVLVPQDETADCYVLST